MTCSRPGEGGVKCGEREIGREGTDGNVGRWFASLGISSCDWLCPLKQLKRAGVPQNQLLHFYTAVIRPVLEYAAPVWHHLINRTKAQQIESIQKRAIHIIYNITRGMSYPNVLFVAELESLETRRNNQSRSFFQDICKPTSCLYHLIPPPWDTSVITRLRPTTLLPKPSSRTKKYCSFINFGLYHYQPNK